MVKVEFYDCGFMPGDNLTYSVISARYGSDWIFVRHTDRLTWEIPGGHIEHGETAEEAAARELFEESGAVDFDLHCVATYSVFKNGERGWGRLFFAEVKELGPVIDSSEIGEVALAGELPEKLTYPDIQPELFRRVLRYTQDLPS